MLCISEQTHRLSLSGTVKRCKSDVYHYSWNAAYQIRLESRNCCIKWNAALSRKDFIMTYQCVCMWVRIWHKIELLCRVYFIILFMIFVYKVYTCCLQILFLFAKVEISVCCMFFVQWFYVTIFVLAIHYSGVFKESITITIAHTYSKGIEQTPQRITRLAHEWYLELLVETRCYFFSKLFLPGGQ